VIQNGSRLPFDVPLQRLAGEVVHIVSVGRLTPQKNFVRAIDTIAQLRGKAVRYTIAGDGPLRAELEERVSQLGLSDIVDLPGFVKDVPGLLRDADVFFMPSEWEGFGLAAVEAMNAALPVVASDIPGLGDVVGPEGVAALRIDPEEINGMAQALSRLIDDRELRLAMGTRGFERSQGFGFGQYVDAHVALYRSLWETPRYAF
jgi:glycosyltransferase involved in cell wall biosynthesis